MDQDLINNINQLDLAINALSLNPEFAKDKLSSIQNERSRIDREMTAFREEMERRGNDFKNKIRREIDGLMRKIASA